MIEVTKLCWLFEFTSCFLIQPRRLLSMNEHLPQLTANRLTPLASVFERFKHYNTYLHHVFGERVRKLSINSGVTCPTRDGSKGIGGCTYCNNKTFSPSYCQTDISITAQLNAGITFFAKRNKTERYLAYFQSYTNTYADIQVLQNMYEEALQHPQVIGLVIGTRPDCISEAVLHVLHKLSKKHFIALEVGVESTLNRTLERIKRGHTFEESKHAILQIHEYGIPVCAHLILGLPGESKEEMLQHAVELSQLPIHSLKLHHLQIVKQTLMANEYSKAPHHFNLFTADEYLELITEFLAHLHPQIYIERFISEAPVHLLIAPHWNGLRNKDIAPLVEKRMIAKDYWQGMSH